MVTFSASLFLLVFGLVRGNAEGWGSTADRRRAGRLAVLLLCAFVAIRARAPSHPMLDLAPVPQAGLRRRLDRAPSRSSASMFAMFLYITIYMQSILGYDPLEAGVRFLPITLFVFFVAARDRGKLAAPGPRAAFLRRSASRWSASGCC